MSGIRPFALAIMALFLWTAISPAAPPSLYSPGFLQPPSYTRYPPNRAFLVPYHPATASWFAPLEPAPRATNPGLTPQVQTPPTSGRPAGPLQPEASLVPRVLREEGPVRAPAEIEVRVPAGADLWFAGAKTRQTGAKRLFESPPLEPGQWYGYDVTARWLQDGKEVLRKAHVSVAAGVRVALDFTQQNLK
jgi:uncharacterized protein (TIGR03000 family)